MEAGLRTLPWTLMQVIVAPLAGVLSTRTGTRPLMALPGRVRSTGEDRDIDPDRAEPPVRLGEAPLAIG